MNQFNGSDPESRCSPEVLSQVLDWWQAGESRTGRRCDVAGGEDADEVLQEVHQQVPGSPRSEQPRRAFQINLRESAPESVELESVPPPIRALALAEVRRAPLRVWQELARGYGLPDTRTDHLDALIDRFPALVRREPDGVTSAGEALSEALRKDTDPHLATRVHEHMTGWLRENSGGRQHAESWAASGDIGRYAANGLAMHAVQAGLFEELLTDGTVIAQVTQEALLDAAHCAYEGTVPGSSPAADAVHLWIHGVVPDTQAEWAAWLHLMATAREDTELASGIAQSGVQLPWATLWTSWRPPGGYHSRYLRPGAVDDLYAVHRDNRSAVAVQHGSDSGLQVPNPATGEVVGGLWHGDVLQEPDERDLTRQVAQEPGNTGPARVADLGNARTAGAGPDEESLYLTMEFGSHVVVAGTGGLFALTPADPAAFPGVSPARGIPLAGCPTVAGAARPLSASTPAPEDLAELFESAPVLRMDATALPADLTDPTARGILTDSGLPAIEARRLALEPDSPDFLAELEWDDELEEPPTAGPFFGIGRWMGATIVIDGQKGHVLRMPGSPDEDGLEGTVVAGNLAHFLTKAAYWIAGREILVATENEVAAPLLRQEIEESLWNIDWRGSTADAWTYPLHND
ncbi:SUKH-4 family immunity protein [Streptomyces sp. NPDC091266]|uniref:SUKH-4 family immunity protein n=1 Tax=Streptomyces sp. NPDC091266 TaxID=3365978 RepID=UPI0038085613